MRTLLLALVVTGLAQAQTSYPMITHVHPAAVQRGKTTTVVVAGQMNFAGTYKALFEGDGIRAEIVPVKGKAAAVVREVTLQVTVAPDVLPGVREFRLASSLGVSSVGQLVISDHPVVVEKAENNTREKATEIPVPSNVAGRIEAAEDVDHYRFKARAGQTLTFEVQCARLQDKMHDLQKHADPILTLYDVSGRELAANDDFYFADSLLTYTVPKDGEYVVQVRDSKYDGDPRWVYALLVTDRPHATHVYPMAVRAGQAVQLQPIGSAAGVQPRIPFTAPPQPGLHEVVLETPAGRTEPVPLLVSALPQVLEQEPNDTPEKATRVTLPAGINGVIGTARDVDHFVFTAKKGQPIRFEVKARRFGTQLRSGLDAILEVLNARGGLVLSNDDSNGKDPALIFNPTADGDYTLRIRDLHSKGGPTFVYHIEAELARPDFTATCDGDKAMIGPGARTAWFVQVARLHGFTGPVKIEVQGLPEGVTVNPLTIQPQQTQGVLVFSAASSAQVGAANIQLVATGTHMVGERSETLTRPVLVQQEIYFPGGGRGLFDVKMQTVAVTGPSDIQDIVVSPTQIVLKPGEEVKLDIEVKRRADFDKGVTLDILLRHLGRVFGNPLPPGVTIVEGKSKTLLGAGSKGHIVLRAAPDAALIENVPICVMAHVSINFVVKVGYASPVLTLSVRK
ncbi:MAG: PPC domain-containing protein [Gemmataceae bacterium]